MATAHILAVLNPLLQTSSRPDAMYHECQSWNTPDFEGTPCGRPTATLSYAAKFTSSRAHAIKSSLPGRHQEGDFNISPVRQVPLSSHTGSEYLDPISTSTAACERYVRYFVIDKESSMAIMDSACFHATHTSSWNPTAVQDLQSHVRQLLRMYVGAYQILLTLILPYLLQRPGFVV